MKKRYAIPIAATIAFLKIACTDRDNEENNNVDYYSDYQQMCKSGEEELQKSLDHISIIEEQLSSKNYVGNNLNEKRAEDLNSELAGYKDAADALDNTLLEARETVKKLFPEKPAGFCSEAYRANIKSNTPTPI